MLKISHKATESQSPECAVCCAAVGAAFVPSELGDRLYS
jgi:hypothetical protein